MKTGDRFESPSGLGFTVAAMDRKAITVKVDRVVRKNGKQTLEVHTRVVPRTEFGSFARPYLPCD